MAVVTPIYLNTDEDLQVYGTYVDDGFTYQYMNTWINRAAYVFGNNPGVTLSVVASGGDAKFAMQEYLSTAGAAVAIGPGSGSASASEADTPDVGTSIVTYQRIVETYDGATAPTYGDINRAFPVYINGDGDIQAMSRQDFLDTFVGPALEAASSGSNAYNGIYEIRTNSSSIPNVTEIVSTTPVFVDRIANVTAFSSGTLPEDQVQFTSTNYYLHKAIPTFSSGSLSALTNACPLYIDSNGDLRQYSISEFDALLQGEMRYYAQNSSAGYKLVYNIYDTATNPVPSGATIRGTGMADRYYSGSLYRSSEEADNYYYSQEVPAGALTQRVVYYLTTELE